MKKNRMFFMAIMVVFMIMSFSSCDQITEQLGLDEDEDSGYSFDNDPVWPYIQGTITVADSDYWEYVEVGAFSRATYTGLEAGALGDDYDQVRMNYDDDNLGNGYMNLTPISDDREIIGDNDELEKEYYVNIPEETYVSGTTKGYSVVAWYDENQDGLLKVYNCDNDDYSDVSLISTYAELNRTPVLEAWNIPADDDGDYEATSFNDARISTMMAYSSTDSETGEENFPSGYKFSGYSEDYEDFLEDNGMLALGMVIDDLKESQYDGENTEYRFNFTIEKSSGY